MKNENRVMVLGTGTSTGIPVIGCKCKVCNSKDIRNKRLRTSVLLALKSGVNILIDPSPDLRYQVITSGIERVDATIVTHTHADHIHGMDDLRPFCFGKDKRKAIPLFAGKWACTELRQRFPYIFARGDRPIIGGGIPLLSLLEVGSDRVEKILEEEFFFFELPHGHTKSLGFFHQGLAYLIDCSEIPELVLHFLEKANVKLLIIDCLRRKKHQTHLCLEESLNYIDRIKPHFAGLIHLADAFDHQELCLEIEERYQRKDYIRPLVDSEILTY
ncbi:MAG: MBL fold metallo-hydrolase [Oligoflexia bacterium]|nr:MBL fold metallo-hydrolase [Oligoflexia bacterium]MBF0365271.1 MBL fold metallo-hydrolase [Oligoflexia bacterium]